MIEPLSKKDVHWASVLSEAPDDTKVIELVRLREAIKGMKEAKTKDRDDYGLGWHHFQIENEEMDELIEEWLGGIK